jgi:hypothetical protein
MNLKLRGFAPDSPCLCHTTEFLRQMPTPESHSLWQALNAESEPHLYVPLVLINSVNAHDDKLQAICSDLLNGHFGALCAQAVISVWCSFCKWAHIFYTISDVQMYNFTIIAGIGIQNLPLHWDSSSVHVFPSTNKFFISYYPMWQLHIVSIPNSSQEEHLVIFFQCNFMVQLKSAQTECSHELCFGWEWSCFEFSLSQSESLLWVSLAPHEDSFMTTACNTKHNLCRLVKSMIIWDRSLSGVPCCWRPSEII